MEATDGIDPAALTGLPGVLLAALEHTRSPTCITTAELDEPGPEIVYVNPAYCLMTGRDRADVIGRTPRLMQGPLTDRAVLDRLRQDLEAGRRFSGETVNYRADGSPFIINWSIDPVRDDSGVITHFVATQQDVTDLVRARNLRSAEQELDDALRRLLGDPRDLQTGIVELIDTVVAGVCRIAPLGTVRVNVVDEETLHGIDAGARTAHAQQGEVAHLEIPFASADESLRGTITLGGLTEATQAFVDADGLHAFARRAGAVVTAFAEYQRQRRTAIRLQESLLPPPHPEVSGFEVATVYRPGTLGLEVGGDWYDVVATEDRTVFTVGDVSGSGVDAAALMGQLRLLSAHLLRQGAAVAEVLGALDDVCAATESMATVIAVESDSDGARIWSAGHLPPVMVRPDGSALVSIPVGPPLGHATGPRPEPEAVTLAEPNTLVLYSDGLVERRGEPLTTGLDRLVRLLDGGGSVRETVDSVLQRLGDAATDDIAVLALRPST